MDSHVLRKAVLAAAGARRDRGSAVQHPGDRVGGGHVGGGVRRGRGRARRRARPPSTRRSRGRCPAPWLLGWSFGTELALRWGCLRAGRRRDPAVARRCSRTTDADLDVWAGSGKPVLALVPELDDYLRPDEARQRFARVPQARVVGVDGARHLWVGET